MAHETPNPTSGPGSGPGIAGLARRLARTVHGAAGDDDDLRRARLDLDELREELAVLRPATLTDGALADELGALCARGAALLAEALEVSAAVRDAVDASSSGASAAPPCDLEGWVDRLVEMAVAVDDRVAGDPSEQPVELPRAALEDECLPDFLVEADELLEEGESALAQVEREPDAASAEIQGAFRAFHSIKGMAGFLALDAVVDVAGAGEELLDVLRERRRPITGADFDLLFEGFALLRELNGALRGATAPRRGRVERTVSALRCAATIRAPRESAGEPRAGVAAAPKPSAPRRAGRARLGELLLQRGVLTPRALELALADQRETGKRLGETLIELGLASIDEIASALRAQRAIGAAPQPGKLPLGALLVHLRLITPRALELALREQRANGRLLGETLVELGFITRAEIDRALELQATSGARLWRVLSADPAGLAASLERDMLEPLEDAPAAVDPASGHGSVRVSAERLDALTEELLGLHVTLRASRRRAGDADVTPERDALATFERVADAVRRALQTALSLRLVSLRPTFERMARVARDVARRTKKLVRVELDADELELDRRTVEALSEPLMHLARNAADHGIELPEQRAAAGKDPRGAVTLRLRARAGTVEICVADDGAGIDVEQVVAKAREHGLVGRSALVDARQMIFLPGLSTRAAAGDGGGQGLGMDVVRRHVEALGGGVSLETAAGAGTTFRLTVPLRLAALDALVVVGGGRRFAIPYASALDDAAPRGPVLRLPDGEAFVRHGDVWIGFCALGAENGRRILLGADGRTACVAVDELQGRRRIVLRAGGAPDEAILADGGSARLFDPFGETGKAPRS